MQWILLIIGALVLTVSILSVVGLTLPRAHRATSVIELKTPPAEVWPLVRDLGQVPTFWTEMKSAGRLPDQNGHEIWSQIMKNGFVIPLEIVEDQAPNRLVTRIATTGKQPFGGSWIYEIEAIPEGSRVALTEDGWVSNPVFRLISRLTGYHKTLDSYLQALGRRLGQDVEPLHR
jgi:uncharacterized protein YndB with AHSA1/START domain